MVISLMISRHAAADCPMNNETTRKVMLEGMAKLPELAKKHGVTILGAWTVHSEHLTVQVSEAPTYEALQALRDEPAISSMMNWYTTEWKVAEPLGATLQTIMECG
jgi:hypothetical protein